MTPIYKILPRADWERAVGAGWFEGSPVDLADGFIHFSGADQWEETARRHFADQDDLMLLTVDADSLGSMLRWETSRGGALFPHLHAPLACDRVIEARPLPAATA